MLPPHRIVPIRRAFALRRLEQRRERRRAGALGELMRVVEVGADRRLDLRIGDLDDVVRAAPDDVERRLHRHAHRHAVRDGDRGGRFDALVPAKRLRVRVGAAWRRRRRCAVARPSASRVPMRPQMPDPQPIGTNTVCEVGHGAEELERVGGDAGDELGLERADEAQSLGLRERRRVLARLVEVAAVHDEIRAERLHRRVLVARVALRHDDRAAHAMPARGEGEALAVVAARRADDAGERGVARLERRQQVEAAAHLERAGRRVVLVLDPDLAARAAREQRPRVLRRGRHRRVDVARGGFDVGQCKQRARVPGVQTRSMMTAMPWPTPMHIVRSA